ncbi:MAG TPA: DUF4349 domain-containing protein [Solirubrobacteraceae bacterium]|nr:DUF4349 domain-containing protein [Solirubrobacteraceae bacterium]
MRSADPLEPEVLAALEAIDATLEGEPVDPEHAELAELALILRAERPVPDEAFLARLDRRVGERFVEPARPSRPWMRRWWAERRGLAATALAAAAAACIAVAVVVSSNGSSLQVVNRTPHGTAASSGSGSGGGGAARSAGHGAGATSTSSGGAAGAASGAGSRNAPPVGAAGTGASGGSAATSARSSAGTSSRSSGRQLSTRAPAAPTTRGRDITQSARVGLQADPGRIAGVAQEVFDVIGAEHGDVLSSHVSETAGAPGYATFSLQVPAARLPATLDRLSRLPHARVLTREDSSADITSRVDNTAAALAGARARRRSLLRQLAATADPTAATRLEREAARALAQIDRQQAALQRLRHRVADSTIAVTVSSPPVVHHRPHSASGGFTFGRALHDAGRILVVAAGVALIALAVLVPVGLVVAFCAWVWSLVLRRRREGALDPS